MSHEYTKKLKLSVTRASGDKANRQLNEDQIRKGMLIKQILHASIK